MVSAAAAADAAGGGAALSIDDVKAVYVAACLMLCMILAVPTIVQLFPLPQGEAFSELWLLGPGHMAEFYPSAVLPGVLYKVYVGVGNHLGRSGNYVVYVKFRNATQPLPNIANSTPSALEPCYEYNVFLGDNATWEDLVSFSFANVSIADDVCRVGRVRVNDVAVAVNRMARWSAEEEAYAFQLFFELWVYDPALGEVRFDNRYVGLQLSMGLE